jgi:hypothetical protein
MKSTSGKTEKDDVDECSDDPRNPGKSPIVRVTFTPPDSFDFSCPEVRMRAAGRVQLHQASPTDQWVFLRVNGLPPAEFKITIGGNGKTLTIDDKHTTAPVDYHYSVTIMDKNGKEHTSPDRIVTNPPMIRNL